MKFLITLIAITLNLCCLAQSASYYASLASQAEREYRYKKALKHYDEAIELDSTNVDYRVRRGSLLLEMDQPQEAHDSFLIALSINPDDSRALFGLGKYFLYRSVADSALSNLSLSLNQTKEEAITDSTIGNRVIIEMISARADAFMLMENWKAAEEDYLEILELDTTNVDAMKNMAFALSSDGREKESIYYLKKIVERKPGDVQTLVNVGYMFNQIGMYRESVEYLNTALQYDGDQPYALCNRGYALLKLNAPAEAMHDLNKSIKNDPENAYAYYVRGLVNMNQGKRKKACKDFNKARVNGYEKQYGKNILEVIKVNCENP